MPRVRVSPLGPYESVPPFELFYRKAEFFYKKCCISNSIRTPLLSVILKNAKFLKVNICETVGYEHHLSIKPSAVFAIEFFKAAGGLYPIVACGRFSLQKEIYSATDFRHQSPVLFFAWRTFVYNGDICTFFTCGFGAFFIIDSDALR